MSKYKIVQANDFNLRAQITEALNETWDGLEPMLPWTWPANDGAPGSFLTTNGFGQLYWTPPVNPPTVTTDDDVTDFSIAIAPAWTLVPVSLTAQEPAASPAHVALSMTLFSTQNNRDISCRLLINGVPDGPVYVVTLQRDQEVFTRHVWEPFTTQGDVITFELSANGDGCSVLGSVTDTHAVLSEPTGVVLSANFQGTANVISPTEFWSRWTDPALEKLAKTLNRQPIGMGGAPSWISVARVSVFVARYSADNINLLDTTTINHMNELVALNVLTPAERDNILAT